MLLKFKHNLLKFKHNLLKCKHNLLKFKHNLLKSIFFIMTEIIFIKIKNEMKQFILIFRINIKINKKVLKRKQFLFQFYIFTDFF